MNKFVFPRLSQTNSCDNFSLFRVQNDVQNVNRGIHFHLTDKNSNDIAKKVNLPLRKQNEDISLRYD